MKHIIAALAGLTLALLAAPTASATPEYDYLHSLHERGVIFDRASDALRAGHQACADLNSGTHYSTIVKRISAANPGVPTQTAVKLLVAAAVNLCPHNAATIYAEVHS